MLLFFAGWEGGNLGRMVKEDDLPLFSASVVSLLDSEMDFWKAKDDDLARFLEEQMKSSKGGPFFQTQILAGQALISLYSAPPRDLTCCAWSVPAGLQLGAQPGGLCLWGDQV